MHLAELLRLPSVSARDLNPETNFFKKHSQTQVFAQRMDSENPALYGQYLKVTTPLILPMVGQNPPGTPLILFAGPGYIEVSKGEPTILHLDPIS